MKYHFDFFFFPLFLRLVSATDVGNMSLFSLDWVLDSLGFLTWALSLIPRSLLILGTQWHRKLNFADKSSETMSSCRWWAEQSKSVAYESLMSHRLPKYLNITFCWTVSNQQIHTSVMLKLGASYSESVTESLKQISRYATCISNDALKTGHQGWTQNVKLYVRHVVYDKFFWLSQINT